MQRRAASARPSAQARVRPLAAERPCIAVAVEAIESGQRYRSPEGRPHRRRPHRASDPRIGYLPPIAAASGGDAAGPPGHAREGPRHLADVDVVAGCRRGARAGLRAGRARLQARNESRDHRRQSAAPVLDDGCGAGAGRRAGPSLPGRGGRGNGLRAERRRRALRRRRGSGAGRQAAGDPGPLPQSRAHRLRRSAGAAPLCAGFSPKLRRNPGDGPRAPRSASGFLPVRDGRGPSGRRGGDGLHVGDHRQAEGCLPDPPRVDHRGARRRRVRSADAGRGRAFVPADGLDRRPPVLVLRMAGGGLHHQLSRVRGHGDDGLARDRSHVLLRAAAGVRESADAGDDQDGGRREAQALGVSLFHGRRPPLRRRDPGRQTRHSPRGPPALRAWQPRHLRPVAQRARDEPDSRGVHRRGGDRAGSVPLLPVDRHQHEAALRRDRDVRLCLPAARRRHQARFGGQAGARRRSEDCARTAKCWCAARRC